MTALSYVLTQDTEEKELDDGHYEGMMLDCGSGETVPDGMGRLRYHQADIFGRRMYVHTFSPRFGRSSTVSSTTCL